MNRAPLSALVLATALACAALPAAAGAQSLSLQEQAVVASQAFQKGHPDLHYRHAGLDAMDRGRPADARHFFTLGARHADKLSQAMLADLWWNGQGGPADRALGYAWMDLAAERGTTWLLARRERFWEALDAAERERAVTEGRALYAVYGDPVAQPRQERVMRRTMGQMTGSRTGALGAMTVMNLRHNGQMMKVLPEVYYADKLWQPAQYWQWQNAELAAGNPGHTRAGPGQPLPPG